MDLEFLLRPNYPLHGSINYSSYDDWVNLKQVTDSYLHSFSELLLPWWWCDFQRKKMTQKLDPDQL